MTDLILAVAGVTMSFFACKIAFAEVVEVDPTSATMTAIALYTTTACYVTLGVGLAAISVFASALAWTLIALRST